LRQPPRARGSGARAARTGWARRRPPAAPRPAAGRGSSATRCPTWCHRPGWRPGARSRPRARMRSPAPRARAACGAPPPCAPPWLRRPAQGAVRGVMHMKSSVHLNARSALTALTVRRTSALPTPTLARSEAWANPVWQTRLSCALLILGWQRQRPRDIKCCDVSSNNNITWQAAHDRARRLLCQT